MSAKKLLKTGTALDTAAYNRQLLGILTSDNPDRQKIAAEILGRDIANDNSELTLEELSRILRAMQERGIAPDTAKTENTPFDPAFLNAVRENAANVQEQLQQVRDQCKRERGFLSKAYNIFASERPDAEIMKSAASFAEYCEKNKITFDDSGKLVAAEKQPNKVWEKVKELRFLIAAAGGAALGLAGFDLGAEPIIKHAPDLFFSALPALAAPFIGLNIFKSFSEYSIKKEAPTLLRFLGITAGGFALAALADAGMSHLIGSVDPSVLVDPKQGGGSGSLFGWIPNPMPYMLPIIGGFTAAALMYKRAKSVVANEFEKVSQGNGIRGALSNVYNKAVGFVMNKHTAPAVKWAGDMLEKATDGINKAFPQYINYVGMPAVLALMSTTMANGGLGLLGQYGNYYATMFTGMALGGLALVAANLYCGVRGKDFKELGSAALTGFSISSSSATMPKEKEALKNIGVSEKTINTVVPLGGVFNMYGTALYMGLSAFFATRMFGVDPSISSYVSTAAAVMSLALGAPGIPASNITLLDPVLQQTGISPANIHKFYSMVIPADRILDMTQTGLNVLGDMIAAIHTDRKLLWKRNAEARQDAAGGEAAPAAKTADEMNPARQLPPTPPPPS